MANQLNLDQLCAQSSQILFSNREGSIIREAVKNDKKVAAKDIERLVTNSLGVLQEQGVYAMVLYLCSKRGQKKAIEKQTVEAAVSGAILDNLLKLLSYPQLAQLGLSFKQANNNEKDDTGAILEHFAETIASDLDKLLLTKRLFEKTLVYTRYGAKAFATSDDEAGTQS